MRLAIVIPTWNEAAALPATLAAARRACPGADILVADGGSTDATRSIARAAGAAVIAAPRGRGRQQNAGAAATAPGNDVLLFLHADTLLPEGAGAAVARALEDPRVLGGNFRLAFEPATVANRCFAAAYNWRARRSRHYYGDSCLWVRRGVFDESGGFREGMLMEDWEFVQRLERRCRASRRRAGAAGGERMVWLPLAVTTSARRFTGTKRWRYLWLWSYLHLLHARGVSGDRLAAMYPDVR
jgi:rSAM/selenodomain-associated transferase 2